MMSGLGWLGESETRKSLASVVPRFRVESSLDEVRSSILRSPLDEVAGVWSSGMIHPYVGSNPSTFCSSS
jgi:hypothetical protein